MKVTQLAGDTLPHVKDLAATGAPTAAHGAAAPTTEVGTSGCITFVGLVKVCYNFSVSPPSLSVTVYLVTPFGDINIGSGTLNPSNPSLTIGGGAFGFKAELTFTANFSADTVTISGQACAPFAGCKSFNTTIPI